MRKLDAEQVKRRLEKARIIVDLGAGSLLNTRSELNKLGYSDEDVEKALARMVEISRSKSGLADPDKID